MIITMAGEASMAKDIHWTGLSGRGGGDTFIFGLPWTLTDFSSRPLSLLILSFFFSFFPSSLYSIKLLPW